MRIFFDNNAAATMPNQIVGGNRGEIPFDAAWCLLGALGDICIMLPMFYDLWIKHNLKSQVIVCRNYAPMFDGVSYVEQVVYPWDYDRKDRQALVKVVEFAKTKIPGRPVVFLNPIECPNGQVPQTTDSFARELWRIAGRQYEWGLHPLVFDQRDGNRELELWCRTIGETTKPVILAALSGHTSPFPQAGELITALRERFPQAEVMDIGGVKAERPFDLLGLMENATALVTIDTMHLHLSAASTVPTIALARDYPTNWNGTPWHRRFQFYCRYGQYAQRKEELLRAIEDVFEGVPRVTPKPIIGLTGQFGYNPSLLEHGDQLLMSYRYHPTDHWLTKPRMATLDREWHVVTDRPIVFPDKFRSLSIEDMRLFSWRDKVYGTYTISNPDSPRLGEYRFPTCVVGYAELKPSAEAWVVDEHHIVEYGKNDWTGLEKNWCPLPHGDRLYFIYSQHPEQVVIEVDGDKVVNEYRSPMPPWAWGEIRGGTVPVSSKATCCGSSTARSSTRPSGTLGATTPAV